MMGIKENQFQEIYADDLVEISTEHGIVWMRVYGKWNNRCFDLMKYYHVNGLILDEYDGALIDSADTVGDFPQRLTRLQLAGKELSEVRYAGTFKQLEQLEIYFDSIRSKIDLSVLAPRLKAFGCYWNKNLLNVDKLERLESLKVLKAPSEEQIDLGGLLNLRDLTIEGAPRLKSIKVAWERLDRIRLNNCPKLDLNFTVNFRNLREFCLIGESLIDVTQLQNAKHLRRLVLSQLGEIESSDFLRSLSELQDVHLLLGNNYKHGHDFAVELHNRFNRGA
jgi:hypothetical protein